ncbi:hypothetical protein EIP86_004352 [Pleurotus ostreatoroseus]|nr:hypothetical protein EIP86_004352 [Pleurotus ostreatoroseus]
MSPSTYTPLELVLEILHFVAAAPQQDQARRAMSACALVSRTWRELVQPLQWRNISIHFLSDDGNDQFDEDDDPEFLQYIRSQKAIYTREVTKAEIVSFFQEHSDVARHVRSLTLAPLDPLDMREVLGRMQSQELFDIVRRLPHLQDLHLSRIWLDTRNSTPTFPPLRLLSVDHDCDAPRLPPTKALAVLDALSDVQQVILKRSLVDCPDTLNNWPISCKPKSIVIQDKALQSFLSRLVVSRAVKANQLQMLHLGPIQPLSWILLKPILEQTSSTLKRLSLSFDPEYTSYAPIPATDPAGGLVSSLLSTCSQLQYLKLQFTEPDGFNFSAWQDVYLLLQGLDRHGTSPLRVLRLEVVTDEGQKPIYDITAGYILGRDIEDLLLRLPHLESVQLTFEKGYRHKGVGPKAQAQINSFWDRLSARGLLHYVESEYDYPAVFQAQFNETARW